MVKLLSLVNKPMSWTVLDQLLVSGVNFITGIILARVLGLEIFGAFAIVFSFFIYFSNIQRVLATVPLVNSIDHSLIGGKAENYGKGYAAISIGIALLCSMGMFFVINLLPLISDYHMSDELPAYAACALFFYLVQDWLRRYLYALRNWKALLGGDFVCYFGQIIVLVVLAQRDMLTLETAFIAISLTSLAGYVLSSSLINLSFSFVNAAKFLRESWPNGKRLLFSWQFEWLASHGVLVLSGVLLGPQAAGAIRVVQNVLGPINIILLAIENAIPVEAARKLREDGAKSLYEYLSKLGYKGMKLFGVALVPLMLVSEWLLTSLYGEVFAVFWPLVALQFIVIAARYNLLLLTYFFRALERMEYILTSTVIWAVITLLSVVVFLPTYGVSAAVASVLVGELVAVGYLFHKANL